MCARVLSRLSRVRFFATLWTIACQAPLPMEILQENSGVGCHFLLQRIFPTQGSNLRLLRLPQGQEHFYH